MPKRKPHASLIVGWREWVSLPDFSIGSIKAKIDSGARSSSLHAEQIRFEKREGKRWVLFDVYPDQRSNLTVVSCAAPLLEMRSIRSSNGEASMRPVVLTTLDLGARRWKIELTLASRDQMGFRMLLGREALRNRVLIHSGRSFMASHLRDDE
jgi:hypothetical protein